MEQILYIRDMTPVLSWRDIVVSRELSFNEHIYLLLGLYCFTLIHKAYSWELRRVFEMALERRMVDINVHHLLFGVGFVHISLHMSLETLY